MPLPALLAPLAPIAGKILGGQASGAIGGALGGLTSGLGGSPTSSSGPVNTAISVSYGDPVPRGSDPFAAVFGARAPLPGFNSGPNYTAWIAAALVGGALFYTLKNR